MAEHALNIKLVGEIEKRPLLYNNQLPEYTRKDLTEKAWNEVGQVVNLSGSECKERWRNLRAVFVRHVKPQGLTSTYGSSTKPKKPYYLFEAMKFALPFIRALHGATEAAVQVKPEMQKIEFETDSDEDNQCPSQQLASLQGNPPKTPSLSPFSDKSVSLPSTPKSSPSPDPLSESQPSPKKTKRAHVDSSNLGLGESSIKRERQEQKVTQKWANKMFLISLLPDMDEMSPSQLRKFKVKVIDSIIEILGNP